MGSDKQGDDKRRVVFSGIQPTNVPHLGNYLGAVKRWAELQADYDCLYCIVDMHAITVPQDPAALRKAARDLLTLYIAAGLDPVRNIVYIQSHVRQHAELAWVLNCVARFGELSRMTQFKDKTANKKQDGVGVGLFVYPVLMAADILLYQTDAVPVGHDQKQHVELARDLAERFNHQFGETFKVPEPLIGKVGARIMSLQEPLKKMSKSDENKNAAVSLLDPPDVIMAKFRRAVTDSGSEVKYAEDKPGVSNLLSIYCAMTNETIEQAERRFEGQGYGAFKAAVGEAVAQELAPIQKRYAELSAEKDYIDGIIRDNALRAAELAERTMRKVKKRVGFPI